MKSYYVICANPKSFIGKIGSIIIRVFETERYSHVAICGVDTDEQVIWESTSPKSRKRPLSDFLNASKVVFVYRIVGGNQEHLDLFLDGLIGKPYAFEQIALVVAASLTKILNLVLRKTQINKEKRMICTELAYRALDYVYDFEKKKNPDKIGIDDFYDVVKDLEKKKLLVRTSLDELLPKQQEVIL